MKILAIETSSDACSVALNYDGEIVYELRVAPREHNTIILPMIDSQLNDANIGVSQLDAIAFGCGPGSFTGIRIAAAVTQGLAVSHDIPVIPVSTLLVMAQTTFLQYGVEYVIPCVDARMDEVYWCACQLEGGHKKSPLMKRVEHEVCTQPERLTIPEAEDSKRQGWVCVGDGWQNYDVLAALGRDSRKIDVVYTDIYPQADALAQLAERCFNNNEMKSAEEALPTYLRESLFKNRR